MLQKDQSTRGKFQSLAILLLILLLALVYRLENFYGMVRSDDFKYAAAAFELAQGNDLNFQYCCGIDRYGITIPVALIYSTFGVSELTTILFPLLMSLLGVVFIYAIALLLANEAVATIAAFIWAIFPLNVFLASQLLPDGIIATLTSGAVLFLLLGNRSKAPGSYIYFAISFFLLIWAYFVKEASLTVAVFFLLYLFSKLLLYLDSYAGRNWPNKLVQIRLVSLSSLALFGGLIFFSLVRFPNGNTLRLFAITATDMVQTFLFGRSPFDLTEPRDQIPDLWVIWVLFALVFVLYKREKSVFLLIGWLGVMYFVSEWGMEVSFSSGFPILYSPPQLWLDARHFLLFWPPLIIMMAIFIANELKRKTVQLLVVGFTIAFVALTLLIPEIFFLDDTHFFRVAYLFAFVGAPVLFLIYKHSTPNWKQQAGAAVVGTLFIATLRPTPNYNLRDWQYFVQLHANIKQASAYLIDQDPQYPIYTLDNTHSLLLNYHSNFQLGFNWDGAFAGHRDPRIVNPGEVLGEDENAFVVLLTSAQYDSVGRSWWPVSRYVIDAEDGDAVTVYRQLSSESADLAFRESESIVEESPTIENYADFLAAAIHVGALQPAIDSWNRLHLMGDTSISVEDFMAAVRGYKTENPDNQSENLLVFQSNDSPSSPWQTDEFVTLDVKENSKSTAELLIKVERNTANEQAVFRDIVLEPSSLYVFQAKVRSSMVVDLIKLDDGNIPDSSPELTKYDDWESVLIIFITPPKNALERPIKLSLMVTNAVGEVSIRNPQLVRLLLE